MKNERELTTGSRRTCRCQHESNGYAEARLRTPWLDPFLIIEILRSLQ